MAFEHVLACQEEQFEDCEYEFRGDCMASCSGDGALFCDGEFVLAGDELDVCFNAIIELGIEAVEDTPNGDLDASGFCTVGDRDPSGPAILLVGLFGLGVAYRRRRAA